MIKKCSRHQGQVQMQVAQTQEKVKVKQSHPKTSVRCCTRLVLCDGAADALGVEASREDRLGLRRVVGSGEAVCTPQSKRQGRCQSHGKRGSREQIIMRRAQGSGVGSAQPSGQAGGNWTPVGQRGVFLGACGSISYAFVKLPPIP